MRLEFEIYAALERFELELCADLEAGIVGISGDSGCGKSSLLRSLAGFQPGCQARIVLDGEVVCDTRKRFSPPPHRRNITLMFQDGLLFPHLSVRQNLLFAANSRRNAIGSRRNAIGDSPQSAELLDVLELHPLLDCRPGELSGGEQQRVALGRTFLAARKLVLLDEPLSSVDKRLKQQILEYMTRRVASANMMIMMVSHDARELAVPGGPVLTMQQGKLFKTGAKPELPVPFSSCAGFW